MLRPCLPHRDARHAFQRAACVYGKNAHAQRAIARRLAAHVAGVTVPPGAWLEIGWGGEKTLMETLAARGVMNTCRLLVRADNAPLMLNAASHPGCAYVLADGETPPFRRHAFTLVALNMTAQWFSHVGGGLARLGYCLGEGGVLAFSLPVRGAFPEWQAAVAATPLAAAVPDFPDPQALRARLEDFKGTWVVEDMQRSYAGVLGFLRVLKNTGAVTARPGHVPVAPQTLRRILRRHEGRFTVTWRILYAVLRKQ